MVSRTKRIDAAYRFINQKIFGRYENEIIENHLKDENTFRFIIIESCIKEYRRIEASTVYAADIFFKVKFRYLNISHETGSERKMKSTIKN